MQGDDVNIDVDENQHMVQLIENIGHVFSEPSSSLSIDDNELLEFTKQNLIYEDNNSHLPIPVYSYMRPTMVHQFILNILLSLGKFSTKFDLLQYKPLHYSFENARIQEWWGTNMRWFHFMTTATILLLSSLKNNYFPP